MTVWRRTDNRTKLGIVIYSFKQKGPHLLALDIGDTVHLHEETEDWFRGCCTKNRSQWGIFPKSYVQVKEAIVSLNGNVETITAREPCIVTEIGFVLREWHTIWKQQYITQGRELERLGEMMYELISHRSKILSKKLTIDDMKVVQQQVTSRIDYGNAKLKLDLVVRDEHGNILNPDNNSVIEVYKRHVVTAERIRRETSAIETENEMRPALPSTFNLFVMLRNFVCKIGEDADILINLYDAQDGKFISENYVVKWSKDGCPKDIDMLNNFRVVFTDLGTKDRARERVFLIFQIVRIGVMDPKDMDNKKQTQGIRRPFGVAAFDVSELIQGTKNRDEEAQDFVPFLQCGEKEFMENVVKKVIVAKEINHKGQGLWVSLKILPGDLKQVKEDYPHLVMAGTAVARKMGFPEVIMPGDVRNDLFVTVLSGEFTKGPTKTTDKNVEVTMQVCTQAGKVFPDVIGHGCGGDPLLEYKSMVYYHEDKPRWFENVKVEISSSENFRDLHLKFLYRHRSSIEVKDKAEKPFAMSYIRLINEDGTTLEDALHELLVYKIESKKQETPMAYLELPTTRQELVQRYGAQAGGSGRYQVQAGNFALSAKDSLQIQTFFCSTKLTHNVDLLGLLKCNEAVNDTAALKLHLERLMKEEGEEIVKFLQDLLDSLFNILIHNSSNELCDNLVFDALVYIIALISDRKYNQFRPVLDAYIANSFAFTMAYNKLMVILKDYVDNAQEKREQSEALYRAMKSLEYIFKFIIRSRELFSVTNKDRGKQQFEISLKQLIESINNMMVYQSDHTLKAQAAALKYISCIAQDVMAVLDPVELSKLMVQFIGRIPRDRLVKQKMKCIDDLVHTELFRKAECRQELLPTILQHTQVLLENQEDLEESTSVLCDVMHILWLPETGPHDGDISTVSRVILRTVIQAVIKMGHSSRTVLETRGRRLEKLFGQQPPPPQNVLYQSMSGRCVAVLMSMLRQMTETHYDHYIASFSTSFDVLDFLTEILRLFTNLITTPVHAKDWMEMVNLQNSIILRALRFFAKTVHERFSNPFEFQLWQEFFNCAISFLTQDALQLETFSPSKRNKIIARYKDMRREAGFEIVSMWFNLGHNKIQFIPDMVGPVLQMTLIPQTELRKVTIPIFFDMMLCEFTQSVPNARRPRNFHKVENAMITQLDALVETGRGDEQYMHMMYTILYERCQGHSELREQGVLFVETIQKLLQRLLEYRIILQDEVKEHTMSCTVNLLDFYHSIGRQEMYVRYLNKLFELHLECDNYTEAAYTLILYANLLKWTYEPVGVLQWDRYQSIQTQMDLKIRVYVDAVHYFDKGQMWEKGIELCKELAKIYEEEIFDYQSLGRILEHQATFYNYILTKMRPEPEYFRVGYYGRGFPSFLQNKVFIYRGTAFERLSDFNAKMQILFPNAELMKTLDVPGEEIRESPKQFLQINAVSPVLELKPQFQNKPVAEQILKYYRVNEVKTFTFSRRSDESSHDVTKMWLERTTMVTQYPLPGIVRWYPVVYTDVYGVSPLESAIETLEAANKKLGAAIEQHGSDPAAKIDPLSMLLNGIIDPAINGGLAKYKEFYTEDYLLRSDCERDHTLVERLKDLTKQQVLLLRDSLLIHKRKAPDSLRPFQDHMEKRFSEMCSIIEVEYGIRVADKANLMATLRRNQSLGNTMSALLPDPASSLTPEATYATPNAKAGNPAGRSQSVFVKAERASTAGTPSKSNLAKVGNFFKRTSQLSTDSGADLSQHRNSLDQPIELVEQLTTRRPPRPDSSEKRLSRPPSNQFRPDQLLSTSTLSLNSNLSISTITSDTSDPDLDEPPPLPEKANSASVDGPPLPRRMSTPTGSSAGLNKAKPTPQPPLPSDDDYENPPPVPKKPPLPH